MIPTPFSPDFLIPGPVWLMKTLALITLTVHLLLMNIVFGGSLLGLVYCIKGKARHLEAAQGIARTLPFAMAYLISFGVAPLLFLQALYGPLVYSAAIVVAPFFWSIVPVLIVAYYTQYLLAWRWDRLPAMLRPILFLLIILLAGFVGFVNVNLFTLIQTPDALRALYLADPSGWHLNAAEVTRLPRALHMFFGALAMAGLFMAYLGIRKLQRDPEQGRWQYRSGATWFFGATLLTMATGAWWLMALPREQMRIFMGGDLLATVAFGVAFLAAFFALHCLWFGIRSPRPGRLLWAGVGSAVLAVAGMVVMRDTLRDAALSGQYDVWKVAVKTQWVAMILFLVLFVGGIALCVWLTKLAVSAFPPPDGPPLGSGGYRMPAPKKE